MWCVSEPLLVVVLVRELPKVNHFGFLVLVLEDCCVFLVLPVRLPKLKEGIHYCNTMSVNSDTGI